MAETPTKAPKAAGKVPGGGDHDRVQMASLHPDGSANQTADYTYIGDKEVVIEAAKRQRAEQAVAATDVEHRGVSSGDNQGNDKDPDIAKLADAQESAAAAAEKAAEADVNARFEDADA